MVYQIRIKGHLDDQWTDWFGGLLITLEEDGDTLITGPVVDQAMLHGLLKKVRDLGMPLVSVNRVEPGQSEIMSNQKNLFMLVGPKGSGKTHIGTLIHQHTDIVFLRVEPIWLSLKPDEDGWKKVEAVIDTMFQKHNKVMIESLGIGEGFSKFHASLAEKYSIKMIRVYADLGTCFVRVKARNNAEHIAVSDDKVAELNKIASAVTYHWNLEINNNELTPDQDIINAVQSINSLEKEK